MMDPLLAGGVAVFLRERKPRFFEGLDAPDIRILLAAETQQRF
jgi:hypothetical protein